MSDYKTLRAINVNDHVEKKNGLSYLSWAWAWDEFKQAYPDATYKVIKSDCGLPYFESQAGVMVYTEVTAGGLTHEMWLPVMDGANKAMKRESYTYKTKYADKACDAFDMFDVNKTIMRCLVKNLAMFGLAIYIYAGEDLPEDEMDSAPAKKPEPAPVTSFAQPVATSGSFPMTPTPVETPAPSVAVQHTLPNKVAGQGGDWSITVTKDSNADQQGWMDAVNEGVLSLLSFAESEADVLAIFKKNKVLFDTYKALDEPLFKELMTEFTKIKEKYSTPKVEA